MTLLPFILTSQENYNFTNITQQNGLSSDNIVCLIQDGEGFIWIGTENGLNRYDGKHFLRFGFDPEDEETLSGNSIYALLEDSRKRFWVGTLNGLNLMIKNTGKFRRIPFVDEAGNKIVTRINEIYEDSKSNIWISTDNNGLFKLRDNPILDQIVAYPFAYQVDSSSSERQAKKIEIRHVDSENLWMSTKEGIDKLHIPSGTIEHFKIPVSEDELLTTGHGFPDLWDGRSHIFLSRDNKIYFLDIKDIESGIRPFDEYFATLPHKLISDQYTVNRMGIEGKSKLIIASRDNFIWVDLITGASTFLDSKTLDKQILSSYNTNSILVDNEDNNWFGTYGGGLGVLWRRDNFINFYEHDPDDPTSISSGQVRGLEKDSQGKLWVGTLGSGLDRCTYNLNEKLNRVQNFQTVSGVPNEFSNTEIIDITNDLKGNIWISTSYGGLIKMDPKTLQSEYYLNDPSIPRSNALSGNRIWGLQFDRNNNAWVGTWAQGLDYLNPETGLIKHYQEGENLSRSLISNYIRTLLLEGDSILWIGTRDGLSRMNLIEETFTHFTHSLQDPYSISDNLVWSIYKDRDENFWVGTNVGLNKFNRQSGQFERYYENDGLPNNSIYGIMEDLSGNLWIITQNGLATKLQENSEVKFQPITSADGLPSTEFLPKAHYLDNQSGRILLGAVKGVFEINPLAGKQDTLIFKPHIHTASIFNISKPESEATHHFFMEGKEKLLNLSHQDKVVEITLSDLSLEIGSTYKYEYYLSGFSNQWRGIGEERLMTFTNLNAGNYTLWVRKKGLDQRVSKEVDLLTLKVSPPWWSTWWAYLIYTLMLIGLILTFYNYQLRRQFRKQETQNLKALDEFKTKLYTNITHEFRTPLTIISGMAGKIIDEPQEWAKKGGEMIKQNSINLLNLVNQLLDLRKLESKELKVNMVQGDIVQYLQFLAQSYDPFVQSKGLKLHYLPAFESLTMDYDPEKILRIISNLLSNAAKFTPGQGHVYIHVNQSKEGKKPYMKVRVEDTGIGIPEDQLAHVFDRFYQVDNSSIQGAEGTGVGLALTRELIQLMGGTVDVKSVQGKGTTFTFQLPITNNSPVMEVPTQSLGSVALTVENIPEAQSSEFESERTGDQNSVDLPTLLIVEDNTDIRKFLIACLEDKYLLVTAVNGQQGIDMALEKVPDLIISDVMMPEKNGFELCETLKEDQRTSHIPIILLTAKTDMESKLTGLKTGADAYLTKPFEQEELMVRLKNLFDLRLKLQAHYRSLVPESLPENKEDEFLQKVRQAVLDNISDESFGITQLCRAVTLSRAQLHNKLKALTGQSTSHFVRSIRLKKAKELLRSSDLNVSEVGYEVGFKNPSHFSSAYQEEFGTSPSETRKSQ